MLRNKPTVVENFADNGALSHYSLIDSDEGNCLWSDDEEEILNTSPNKQMVQLPELEESLIRIGMPNSEGRDLSSAYNAAVNMYEFIIARQQNHL